MKKVMKFSAQTQKVHSVLDVRGKSEKEASAFQTMTSLRMGWHRSGRQRTQTGCWSSAAEPFPNGISHADSAQISASLSSTPRHRLIDSENLLLNHTHRSHKCAMVKIILAWRLKDHIYIQALVWTPPKYESRETKKKICFQISRGKKTRWRSVLKKQILHFPESVTTHSKNQHLRNQRRFSDLEGQSH